MTDYDSPKPQKKKDQTLSDYEQKYYRDYAEALQNHNDNIKDYDAYEAMDMAKVFDEESKKTKNGLTDSMTATIYGERAARVVGQLPKGQIKALGKKDTGKGMLMDLIRTNWIFPNANAQRSLKQKLYRWQYRKSKYGWSVVYVDINVAPSGYYGPNLWNCSNRNFLPQPGFETIADMDYVHYIVYKSPQWVLDLLDQPDSAGYHKETIEEMRQTLKEATRSTDSYRDDSQTRQNQSQTIRQIAVATRYESGKDGKWITFLPAFGCKVIREIDNPHKNEKIPFVNLAAAKDSESWYTAGDFHTSMPMQAANDGVFNSFFKQMNRNLNPPTVVNAQTVIPHAFNPNEPGSILQMNGPVGDVKVLESNANSLNFFQSSQSVTRGALQSIAGTTDTRTNAEAASDPAFGKTPEALKMISEREATRDAQDRDLFEEAFKEVVDLWLSIILTIPEKVPVDLFSEEAIEIVKNGGEDLLDLLENGKKAKLSDLAEYDESESGDKITLRIDPKKLKGLEYRFELEPNSSAKQTKEAQLDTFMGYIGFLGKIQNVVDNYTERTGKVMSLEKVNETFANLTDIPGLDELFIDAQPEEAQPSETSPGTSGEPGANPGTIPMPPEAVSALANAPAPMQPVPVEQPLSPEVPLAV